MSDNLNLWRSVERTDPAHVKEITGKAYRGNSPKPHWIIYKATEAFGPCGIGWGFSIVDEKLLDGAMLDTGFYERIHMARIKVWYEFAGKRGEIEHVGQTVFSGRRKDGKPFTDEDAPKKSVTDALVKALSMIGFAGDIFMGRWDDAKYVQEIAADFRAEKIAAKKSGTVEFLNLPTNSDTDRISPAMAYVIKAKTDMRAFATVGELKAWWAECEVTRTGAGVIKGTDAYADLFVAFRDLGVALSIRQPEHAA